FAPDLELAFFRIVQESLSNVYRHSGSPEVDIHALVEKETLILEIEDRGCGMALPGQGEPREVIQHGVGIPGMQERARLLGGELAIESAPGRTVVKVRFPVIR